MKKFNMMIILLFLLSFSLYGKEIIGIGIGKNEKTAKDMALKDLSDNISVDVMSESDIFSEESNSDFNMDNKIRMKSFSNHFLMGLKYEITKIGKEYKVKAILDDDSIRIYENSIVKIDEEIKELMKPQSDLKEHLKNLQLVQDKLSQREKFTDVLTYIGVENIRDKEISMGKIKREIKKAKESLNKKVIVYVDVRGEISKNQRVQLLNKIKRSTEDERIVITGMDKNINYFVDVDVNEMIEKVIPETAIKPKRYVAEYNCMVIITDDKTGKDICSKTISNSIEGYNERILKENLLDNIGENIFGELSKNI
ncbi:hypothetical protein [Cetobacterium sp. SF1]|uniref:hypothetical protein n=1 Tax=Cetobacterium sp. SF1 TaxID=3417654 RepID=UPI003CE6BE10